MSSPANNGGGGGDHSGSGGEVQRSNELMVELRKYLLLLAILAATVTYVAGLNPPGGVWLDTKGGHLTGNQILVVTYHVRYNAFSYSNATAFMASAVVILLLVFAVKDEDTEQDNPWLSALRVVMVLELLALVVAYAAGASRDTLTTVSASLLVSLILIYVLLHAVMMPTIMSGGLLQSWLCSGQEQQQPTQQDPSAALSTLDSERKKHEEKRRRKILMLLAIFATTITYTAGLNPPGGFWPDTADDGDGHGHRAGDPVLQHHHRRRFVFFFFCNTISFVASLFVIMLLLTNRFLKYLVGRFEAKAKAADAAAKAKAKDKAESAAKAVPYVSMAISLLGLVGAYAAGSCRETESTAGVVVLYVVGAMLVLACFVRVRQQGNPKDEQGDKTPHDRTLPTEKKGEDGQPKAPGLLNTAPSLVLLLATLAAAVTYQAGLNPPGGFWPDDRDGHKGGDPILLTKHAARQRLFFYCNSTALAASLVVIFMILTNYLSTRGIKNNGSVLEEKESGTTTSPTTGEQDENKAKKRHIEAHVVILEVVVLLDLIALIGAFAAGCCREVSTSIYVVALAGGTLVYVVFHIVFFTLHRDDIHQQPQPQPQQGGGDDDNHHQHKGSDDTEEKRKLLLLLAILAVTLTYQAGLTPPGGFWLGDDSEAGHRAGDPVLLSNYPRRYTAFFYLNATGFMASVALTILLVNPNLYRAAIKSHALHVCMVAALLGLTGAYAAGSSRHVRTSIYMIALIVVVSTFVLVLLLVFKMIPPKCILEWLSKACCICQPNAAGEQSPGIIQASNDSTVDDIEKAELEPKQKPEQSPSIIQAGNDSTVDDLEKAELEPKQKPEQSPGIIQAGNDSTVHALEKPEQETDGEATRSKEVSSTPSLSSTGKAGGIGLHTQRRYLMLLGILAASVTYQAGLAPPGGFWPDNDDGHAVGDPILRDSRHHRYRMFFSCNCASFVASVVVITLQLLVDLATPGKNREAKFLVQTARYMMLLDLVGLLLAYAAGSAREWETSGYIVLMLVAFCIGIHFVLSYFKKHCGGVSTTAASSDKVKNPARTLAIQMS